MESLDIKPLMSEPYVLGLAEVMNYPGVVYKDPEVLEKINVALVHDKRVDGHAPELAGPELNAYAAARITSDHECTSLEEAKNKLAVGMHIHIREGSTAKDLKALSGILQPATAMFCSFVTDDRNPLDLLTVGHIDSMLRDAVSYGVDPITAIMLHHYLLRGIMA